MESSNNGSKICDVGIVRSLFKDNTFTFEDCFTELYHNSDDAEATNLTVSIIDYDIRIHVTHVVIIRNSYI